MEQAAVALASVISNSGVLANELVLSETSASIEKLQGTNIGMNASTIKIF